MDQVYLFNSHPLPIAAYQTPSFMSTPHPATLNTYPQSLNMTPYPHPGEYMTAQHTYLYPQPASIPHMSSIPHIPHMGGIYPYNHPIFDEEPSCIESLLENLCCCFGFGVPRTHYEAMQKHEVQRRRLIAKEERNRIAQYQKALQEKQRQAQLKQQQATTAVAANKTTITTDSDSAPATSTK